MNRRGLLAAAPAAVALAAPAAGAAAGVLVGPAAAGAAATPSAILHAARQIAALNRQHEQADVPHGDDVALDRLTGQIGRLQRSIIAATPTTATEALVVLMMATGDISSADGNIDAHEVIAAGLHAAARASRCLAGALGVTVAEFGGDWCLPAPQPLLRGRGGLMVAAQPGGGADGLVP